MASTASRVQAAAAQDADTLSPPNPSLFDPSHIPSILPRIEHLTDLLIQASAHPHTLNEPLTPEQRLALQRAHEQRVQQAREAERAAREAKGPNVALGASTEGDDQDTYAFFVGPQLSLLASADRGQGGGSAQDPAQGGASTEPALADALTKSRNNTDEGLNDALLGRPTALRESIIREAQALQDAFAAARRAVDAIEGGDMSVHEQADLIRVLAQYAARQDEVREALYRGAGPIVAMQRDGAS